MKLMASRVMLFKGRNLLAIVILFTLIISFLPQALAFKCYVCDSKDDIDCTEKLPKKIRLTPKDCKDIVGAKYCIKTTNMYAGDFGTKRFCSANDHGNRCSYISPSKDQNRWEYRSCVYTCSSEGCNGSNALFNRQGVFYVASIWTLLSCILMTTIMTHG